ncbi:DUF1064 domain-containing protein [Pectinatus frisingensis]|uniref:DUF1064 domain-containing protein n=1 Tax=Pectinatus frisingensis TaxID=865 RepID=UPI0018C6B358|nr:DUF1064 domain-containing protein [Pectinatus frisingensis]
MITLTPKQAKRLGLQVKTEKYHREKAALDGILFDSKKERDYYARLLLLKRAGEIVNIELQPKFELQPGFERNGKKEQAIIYRADFKVSYADGHIEIVDTKGFKTDVYGIKRKMLLYRYPNIEFKEV